MKFISTFFLFSALAALLYVNVGELARIESNIAQAKNEANTKVLSPQQFTTLTIPVAEVGTKSIFFTDKNELRYQGKLYDVVHQKQAGGMLYLQVVADEKEEGLVAALKDNVEQWFKVPQPDGAKKSVGKQPNLLKDFLVSKRLIVLNQSTLSIPYFGINIPRLPAPVLLVAKSPPQFQPATV